MNNEVVEAAPANLTVAQLSQALKPKPVAAPESKTEPDKSGATVADPLTTREPSATRPGARAETEPADPDLSQANATNANEGEGEGEPKTAAEGVTEADDQPETEAAADKAAEDEPAAPKLPKELLDAIEIAKGDGKRGVSELLKRVNKVVDQRDTERNKRLVAEERLTTLETELAEAKAQAQTPERSAPGGPQSPAMARINEQLAEVNGFIEMFRKNPEGVELDDGKGGKTELNAAEVAEYLETLRDRRTELVAQRSVTEQTLRQRHAEITQQIRQKAGKLYPWLNQPEAPEQQRMAAIVKAIPGLKDHADHELIVARYLRGVAAEQAELAKANGSRKAPPAREPTKVVAETPGGKAGGTDAKGKAAAEVKAAELQFAKTGSARDMQALETARMRLRRLS